MPKNIVICCDGTNNEFGPENTNVVRLVQSLERDPERQQRAFHEPKTAIESVLHGEGDPVKQRLYYDPGVGTLHEATLYTKISEWISRVVALAIGTDLPWKVQEAYTYLMDAYEPGDRVYLFGFSRGAYTVRVLAGMLHVLGLLPRGNHNLVPYAVRLFGATRKSLAPEEDVSRNEELDAKLDEAAAVAALKGDASLSHWDLCRAFRWTFARVVPERKNRRFPVHYLGVWDTVSSVGWAWNPKTYPYTRKNPSVGHARHAISIDERRWFFRQNQMEKAYDDQDLQERWFAGVHSDVGGGYPRQDGKLWLCPFLWILNEAETQGLIVDPRRRDLVTQAPPESARPWDDMKHESLTGLLWNLAEFVPKRVSVKEGDEWVYRYRIGDRQYRRVPKGSLIDRAALLRMRQVAGYSPPNLSAPFKETVLALAENDVPETLPYAP